ncbi:MAG: imidazolonepropionase [Planctomycetota bacterium]
MIEKVELLVENCACLLFPNRSGEGEEVLRNATFAVADGRIRAVGTREELAGRYTARRRIDATGKLVSPGFVDSHTHLVFGGNRADEYMLRCQGVAYEEIAARGGGIRASVRHTRAASEDELFALALPRLLRMARHGTTTVEIKSGYGLDLETELRMLRVIRRLRSATPLRVVATFMGAHEVPDELRGDRQAYVDQVCDTMIPRVAEEGLAEFCDVFCEDRVFTPEESTRILTAGKRHGLRPKIHADELAASGGSRVAGDVGCISADHLMMTDDAGIHALQAGGVVATILPGTTFFLRKPRYAPARKFLDAGLPVAIATDRNPGSCTIESMQFILGLSCLQLGLTPIEAFRAATENGARALGLAATVGSLAPGAAADFVIWEAAEPSQIAYEFANDLPRTVFVAGEELSPKEYS